MEPVEHDLQPTIAVMLDSWGGCYYLGAEAERINMKATNKISHGPSPIESSQHLRPSSIYDYHPSESTSMTAFEEEPSTVRRKNNDRDTNEDVETFELVPRP